VTRSDTYRSALEEKFQAKGSNASFTLRFAKVSRESDFHFENAIPQRFMTFPLDCFHQLQENSLQKVDCIDTFMG